MTQLNIHNIINLICKKQEKKNDQLTTTGHSYNSLSLPLTIKHSFVTVLGGDNNNAPLKGKLSILQM